MCSPVAEAIACQNQHARRISFPRTMRGKRMTTVTSNNRRYGGKYIIETPFWIPTTLLDIQRSREIKRRSLPQDAIEIDAATVLLYYQPCNCQAQAIATYS